jgi:spore maturation protein SpmB
VLDMAVGAIAWAVGAAGMNTDFVSSLPTAVMKSISGSGARAMAIEVMKTQGVDSFAGRLVSILQGTSDTTFYIIALYFGSVGITKTRYAVTYGLLADFAAVVASIWVGYVFFH